MGRVSDSCRLPAKSSNAIGHLRPGLSGSPCEAAHPTPSLPMPLDAVERPSLRRVGARYMETRFTVGETKLRERCQVFGRGGRSGLPLTRFRAWGLLPEPRHHPGTAPAECSSTKRSGTPRNKRLT